MLNLVSSLQSTLKGQPLGLVKTQICMDTNENELIAGLRAGCLQTCLLNTVFLLREIGVTGKRLGINFF